MKRLPVLLTVLFLALIVAGNLIPPTAYSERGITLLFSLFAAPYAVVGGLVATRRSENPVGWLMLGIGGLMSVPVLLGAYAGYGLLQDQSLPLARGAAWVTSWMYWPALGGIALLVIIFPGGRIEDRFRTWAARTCVAAFGLTALGTAITPGPMDGFGTVTNPVGVTALEGLLDGLVSLASGVAFCTFLVALASIFVRLRRAHGVERQQLKWFAYATVMMVLAQVLNLPLLGLDESLVGLLGVVVALTALPVAVALAILRHSLYDIDVVIKRTLVYATLTGILLATYLLSVLMLQVVLRGVTGDSDLAVAVSTLAVAALFRPLRAAIQGIVDRRFFRSRYDAARTLDEYSARLRHELDLEALRSDLQTVVQETMQPAHVSLWLRQDVDREAVSR